MAMYLEPGTALFLDDEVGGGCRSFPVERAKICQPSRDAIPWVPAQSSRGPGAELELTVEGEHAQLRSRLGLAPQEGAREVKGAECPDNGGQGSGRPLHHFLEACTALKNDSE